MAKHSLTKLISNENDYEIDKLLEVRAAKREDKKEVTSESEGERVAGG